MQILFTATKDEFIPDVVNVTISAETHILGISLSPALVDGENMRLVMNWVNRQMDLDLLTTQIDM